LKMQTVIAKKPIAASLIVLSICAAGVMSGAGKQGHVPDDLRREDSIRRILESHEKVIPESIDDAQLKELGETVMNRVIADPALRYWINDTMGGRNSECLKEMYAMIGYRFLQDQYSLRGLTDNNRISAGYAVMRSRIRERGMETGRNPTRTVTLMGYLMFLFLVVSALGSSIFMIRLIKGRMWPFAGKKPRGKRQR
jgi:hypothetical protein